MYKLFILILLSLNTLASENIQKSIIIDNIKLNGINEAKRATLLMDTTNNLYLARDKKYKSFFAYENFENAFLYDNVRIFYTFEGEHALIKKFRVDANKNKIPDFIEDIMTETISTKILLDSYGYHLFDKKDTMYNYQEIQYLDIIISNSNDPRRRSAYFSGYRNNIRYSIINKNRFNAAKSILMRVHQPGRRLKKSVPHEIFHAYQYNYTRLLNAWFTEASAVWFEYALSKGVGRDERLPKSLESLDKLLSKAYKANTFWNRITKLTINNSNFTIPPAIEQKTTYLLSKNEFILSDNLLYGIDFMQILFENLHKQNNIATIDFQEMYPSMTQYKFSKKLRKSKLKDPYMLRALKNTILEVTPQYKSIKELREFVALIDAYLLRNTKNKPILKKVKLSNSIKIQTIKNNLDFKYTPDKKCRNDSNFARNILDMKLYDNKIYIGTGNSRNKLPSCNAGPVPIIYLDITNDAFHIENQKSSYVIIKNKVKKVKRIQNYVKEEKINNFLELDDTLMFTGQDSTQSWAYSSIYKKSKNADNWIQYRTIKNAVHVYDLESHEGNLFTAVGMYKDKKFKPAVAISRDHGKHWEYQYLMGNGSKAFNILKIGNTLLVNTLFSGNRLATSQYINGKFQVNKILDREFFFPNTSFKKKKIYIRKKINIDKNTLMYIGQYSATVHNPQPIGLYTIENKNGKLKSKKNLITKDRVLDFVKYDKNIFVLSDNFKNGIYTIKVYSSNIDDLNNWREVIRFNSLNIVRSFEVSNKYFYFGVGIELDSNNTYYQHSKKSDIGNILKIIR